MWQNGIPVVERPLVLNSENSHFKSIRMQVIENCRRRYSFKNYIYSTDDENDSEVSLCVHSVPLTILQSSRPAHEVFFRFLRFDVIYYSMLDGPAHVDAVRFEHFVDA